MMRQRFSDSWSWQFPEGDLFLACFSWSCGAPQSLPAFTAKAACGEQG